MLCKLKRANEKRSSTVNLLRLKKKLKESSHCCMITLKPHESDNEEKQVFKKRRKVIQKWIHKRTTYNQSEKTNKFNYYFQRILIMTHFCAEARRQYIFLSLFLSIVQ